MGGVRGRRGQGVAVEDETQSVWPLARALLMANLIAAAILGVADDAVVSTWARVLYLEALVALPIVILGTVLGALGYWYRLSTPLVTVAAPLLAWVTWGLMVASEGSDDGRTGLLLLVAQVSAIAVTLRAPDRERA